MGLIIFFSVEIDNKPNKFTGNLLIANPHLSEDPSDCSRMLKLRIEDKIG